MNRPSTTAREALIAEAIGDVAQLLDRVDALTPTMHGAQRALVQATALLADHLLAFETRMAAITENAKTQAVHHIVGRTAEVARRAADAQSRAMEEAARALFRTEVDPALQRLVIPLRQLVERLDRPWEGWLTHAATAVAASAATWVLATWLWAR